MIIYCPRVFVTWRMLKLRENGLNIDYMYETNSVLRITAETEISDLTFWLRFGSVRVFINRNRTEIRFPHIPNPDIPTKHANWNRRQNGIQCKRTALTAALWILQKHLNMNSSTRSIYWNESWLVWIILIQNSCRNTGVVLFWDTWQRTWTSTQATSGYNKWETASCLLRSRKQSGQEHNTTPSRCDGAGDWLTEWLTD